MNSLLPVASGDRVQSEFQIVDGLAFSPASFTEPHIGIAAQLSDNQLTGNANIVRFWEALGATSDAIWQPGVSMPGGDVIGGIVNIAADAYKDSGLLPPGATHNIFGEVVCFDGMAKEPDDEEKLYSDNAPHIDFVPAEIGSAVLFATNKGGTAAWRGGFYYASNTQPSYADQVDSMERVEAKAGEFIFSPDARTFMHARSDAVSNAGRVLIRVFIGQ